jgi:hypothetical protein
MLLLLFFSALALSEFLCQCDYLVPLFNMSRGAILILKLEVTSKGSAAIDIEARIGGEG